MLKVRLQAVWKAKFVPFVCLILSSWVDGIHRTGANLSSSRSLLHFWSLSQPLDKDSGEGEHTSQARKPATCNFLNRKFYCLLWTMEALHRFRLVN